MHKQYLWVLVGALALVPGALSPARGDPPPAGWTAENINAESGSTNVVGTDAAARWTVTALSEDIWASADSFHFVYRSLPGDGGITARLLEQTGGHDDGWAKTGTMLRENTDPSSRFAMMPYNNGPAYKFQPGYRLVTGEAATDLGLGSTAGRRLENGGPIWIRTQRQGQLYQNLLSDDGKSWRLITSVKMDIPAGTAILAGLCAASHGGDVPVVVVFDNVSVTADVVQPAPAGPTRVQVFPSQGTVLITFRTVANASGYNIYRQSPDDPAPVRVNKEPTPYSWFVDQALANGVSYRYFVRAVVRNVAGDAIETLDSPVVLAEPQVPIPPGFVSVDVGTQTPGSTQLDRDTGILTLTASGRGIQDESDGMRFLGIPMFADYSVSARILEKPSPGSGNTAPVKAGVMIRETLDPGSPYAAVLATTNQGVIFQWRRGFRLTVNDTLTHSDGAGGPGIGTAQGTGDEAKYPQWLRVTRAGSNILGFQSDDGTNYTQIGNLVEFRTLTLDTYAGLAVTSGSEGKLGTAKFEAASVTAR